MRRLKHYLSKLVGFFWRKKLQLLGADIGKSSFISLGAWIDNRRGKVIIGERVHITRGVKVLSHDAVAERLGKMGASEGVTIIKDGAFIGMNSVILCGVTVGENSIVGAGSVVTKDVPDSVVVAGNPAVIIRELKSE